MEFQPDNASLASARLDRAEIQAAFNTLLMNAAAIDCGTIIYPDLRKAEFGESLAVNLAMVRRFSPENTGLYRVLLADYLRFCRMYIANSAKSGGYPAEDGFNRLVLKSLMQAVRSAYRKGKKEIPNVY